jgi:hypothetical protein
MYKFTQGKGWQKALYSTRVSGDGEADKEEIERAVGDFEKKYPDFEILGWVVQCKINTHVRDADYAEIYTEQHLVIKAKKRRRAPGKKAKKKVKKATKRS